MMDLKLQTGGFEIVEKKSPNNPVRVLHRAKTLLDKKINMLELSQISGRITEAIELASVEEKSELDAVKQQIKARMEELCFY